MHDIKTGFHDIKALPLFSPTSLLLPSALLAITALLLGALYLSRRKKRVSEPPPTPPIPPDQQALNELRELDKLRDTGEIELRDFAQRLSLSLRRFMQEVIPFPAAELTPGEIKNRLPAELKKSLPTLPNEKLEQLRADFDRTLRFCEFAEFAAHAEELCPMNDDRVTQQISHSTQLIRQLSLWLAKEKERTNGIVAQSRLGQAGAAVKPVGRQ